MAGKAGLGQASLGLARQARSVLVRQCMAGLGEFGYGRRGSLWIGKDGEATRGKFRSGVAGKVCLGKLRHGRERQARLG